MPEKTSVKAVTYYMPVPGLWPDSDMRALLELWEKSWRAAGWETCILQEHHAREHTRFSFFKEIFDSKPSRFGREYTTACFIRWLAAAVVGFGENKPLMLCDFDVMNYYFAPRPPKPGKMEIICDRQPGGVFMGTVLGIPQHFLDMAELFAAWKPDHCDYSAIYDQFHMDDLRMLERMFDEKTLPKPDWLVRTTGCSLFPYPGWKTAPMTHYAYGMKAAGFWPKHRFIPELRPISYGN
jgi:hypothetical protein